MTAYVIFFVDSITDPDGLKRYQQAAHPSLVGTGGRVTVAYGRQAVLEGPPLAGVVMVEFPTFEAAEAWYRSDAYQTAAKLRAHAASCHAVIVEGRPPAAAAAPGAAGR